MNEPRIATDRTDEAALISRARAGEPQACRTLVELYEGAVAATVIGMLGPGDDADDVGQETFIRFFKSLDQFRGESAVKTWVQRIAMNLSLNALKARKRSTTRFLRFDDPAEKTDAVTELQLTISGEFDACETHLIVHRALDRLPPKHRAVVVLRMIDGCSTREAAEALGVPEGTVLSRLARAMKQLEQLLAPTFRPAHTPTEGFSR